VTGTVFATQGHDVTCVDIDQKKIDLLNDGVLPIYEPGLDELVVSSVERGALRFTTDAKAAAATAEVLFLAVGTPQSESGAADLSYLLAAAESVACALPLNAIVVIKSTVPVGTNRKVAEILRQVSGRDIEVANNPEFLKEGTAIDDCLCADRIVLGVRSERVAEVLQHLYQPLASAASWAPVVVMDPESAEMTKYAANCLLATKISFINEMANLCEGLGANIESVRNGIGLDRRIGFEFLQPGAGYGGSCFPKDVRALVSQAADVGFDPQLLKCVDEVNERQKSVIPNKLFAHFRGDVAGKRIAVWGLAFKPGTDDIREAPALVLLDRLLAAGAEVVVHDPEAMDNVRAIYGDRLRYETNKWDAARKANALVVMTDWREYVGVDPGTLRWYLGDAVIFDGRNCLKRHELAYGDFLHYGIGQGPQPDQVDDSDPAIYAIKDYRPDSVVLQPTG
jgi:UDPglucose 6-dehydrogenase